MEVDTRFREKVFSHTYHFGYAEELDVTDRDVRHYHIIDHIETCREFAEYIYISL